MKRQLIILFLVIGVNGCVLIPCLIPFNNIPQPTGIYSVGTQVFEWEDVNREEWFTEDIGDFRRLVVQVWYPTLEESNQVVSYIDSPDKRIGPLSKRIELPQFLIRHIQDVKSNSILNAPIRIDNNLYPLILFSNGLGGMRMQNTVQMEELASRGYVVVAMDHPYDANVTVYHDGTTADFRSGLREDASEKEFWDVRIPQINTRADDLSFIINKINLLKENGDPLWKSVNLSKIGVFGHSYGGGLALLFAKMYKKECLCSITIDMGPTHTLKSHRKKLKNLIKKNGKMIKKYFNNNENLHKIINKIKNSLITKKNVNKELEMIYKLIDYKYVSFRVKNFDKKLSVPTLFFKVIYHAKDKKWDKIINDWSLEEREEIIKNNKNNMYKFRYFLNGQHFIWYDQENSNDMINDIKLFINSK